MRRVEALVEGQTEFRFVEELLAPHLIGHGVHLWPILSGKPGRRSGGVRKWTEARQDILRSLHNSSRHSTTLMVDYYGMPDDWPGREASCVLQGEGKALAVENAIRQDIEQEFPGGMKPVSFLPYVQLHEFEALLFAGESELSKALVGLNPDASQQSLQEQFSRINAAFPSPEMINDDPATSPSHRIKDLVRIYKKPLIGATVATEIGIARLRACCPHFARWLGQLEQLGEAFSMNKGPGF